MIHRRRRSPGGDKRDNLIADLDRAYAALVNASSTRNADAETFDLPIPDELASVGVVSLTHAPDAWPEHSAYVATCDDGVEQTVMVERSIDQGMGDWLIRDLVRAIARAA